MRHILLFFFVFSFGQTQAQETYWVFFNDLSRGELAISQESLIRRQKQGIQLSKNDYSISQEAINELRKKGFRIKNKSRWFNAVSVYAEADQLNDLRQLPSVKSVERVGRFYAKPIEVGGDRNSNQSIDPNDYGDAWNQIRMLNGHKLHQEGTRGSGVIVAVLDAGFNRTDTLEVFQKMRNEGRLLGWKNFVKDTSTVFYASSHGTQVLSCMAADLAGTMIGTAPDASYWLLMSEDVLSETPVEEDNWVAAAEFADSVGAQIINSSLGYTRFDHPWPDYSYSDMDGKTTIVTRGAQMAASKGILVVNSQGNEGASSWTYMVAPADGDSVFSIGGVDPYRNYAFFSSKGPTYDGRIKPNVVAQGQSAVVAGILGGTHSANGTSFASPIIAGMAATLWGRHPFRSNMEIFQFIQKSADRYHNPNNELGYGIPDFALADEMLVYNVCVAPVDPFSIFPNPSSGYLYVVKGPEVPDDAFLDLISSEGKLVYRWEVSGRNIHRIDLPSYLAKGIYHLRYTDDKDYSASMKFHYIYE